MQHWWIQGNDVVFPNTVSFLVVQVKQEVFLCNSDIHGSAGEPHGLFYDAVCEYGETQQGMITVIYLFIGFIS